MSNFLFLPVSHPLSSRRHSSASDSTSTDCKWIAPSSKLEASLIYLLSDEEKDATQLTFDETRY